MKWFPLLVVPVALFALAPAGPAEEKKAPAGFTSLFNGKDLTGWQGAIQIDKRLAMPPERLAREQKSVNERVLPHWTVENGALVNDGKGGNLATVKDYGDFELYVDWKIEPKGDSGIYLRGIPQVQIWDSDSLNPKQYVLERGKGSGALWNNSKKEDKVPLKRADRAPGEWNTFHITMKGDKVTVRLNGELVVDNVVLENLWQKGKPLPARGPIELQQHPKQDGTFGKIQFRNIFIKEL